MVILYRQKFPNVVSHALISKWFLWLSRDAMLYKNHLSSLPQRLNAETSKTILTQTCILNIRY